MSKILEVKNLSKTYKNGNTAIKNLNFSVDKGEILGFLGPNGAGKSTTISIISTLLNAESGKIVYFDSPHKKIKHIKKSIGIVPQELAIYEDMSAYKNVEFFASLYGVKKNNLTKDVDNAMERVGLLSKKNDLPSSFSGGMKRRLNIACAIAHNPKLLILDEPTVGIDPQSRNHILDSLLNLRNNGTTIIYTTHYMEEVQAICNRVLIMDSGNIIMEGAMPTVLSKFNHEIKYEIMIEEKFSKSIVVELLNLNHIIEAYIIDKTLFISINTSANIGEILVFLINKDLTILEVKKKEKNLEEVFLSLTGKDLRD
ncbi:MAG: ABC transporter ATP-binding protein [Bacilli bacterium]